MRVLRVCASLWALCLFACTFSNAPPAPPRRTALGLSISTLELTNGLRVVVVKDPTATDIQVTMQYGVGAADDPDHQAGMAHLVEHLMFEQVMGAQTLNDHLEDVTSEYNGFTSYDATTYTARTAPQHLDKLLAIEAVRVGFRCQTITEPVFAREREVVANEVRLRDESTAVYSALHRSLYPARHPYTRAITGSVESVRAISFGDACAFADKHYAPSNGALVISGDLPPGQIEAALGKFIARVAKRQIAPRAGVSQPAGAGRELAAELPIDDDAVLFAWALPPDPLQQVRVRAIFRATTLAIDNAVAGRVEFLELGDSRAPMLALAVAPGDGETVDAVIKKARKAVGALPREFQQTRYSSLGDIAWDNIRQSAIHGLYSRLDEDMERDQQLAAYVIAGHDPADALAREFKGLREMSQRHAAAIATTELSFAQAAVVKLRPSSKGKQGRRVEAPPPIHGAGGRRTTVDPADALKPIAGDSHAEVRGMTTRTLPNGMEVVLLPLSNVPTVDVRLVFRSGTVDEPQHSRGAALVAAYGLEWDLRYLNDLVKFFAAGGTHDVGVYLDHTTFGATGVDMHLDVLLAGLRRWVRDGTYDDLDRGIVLMRRHAKKLDEDDVLLDAWRGALYGDKHPYTRAGIARHISQQLTANDAAEFRAAHYTPDNATLIIAGHFDAALADRWVDYLFKDWSGRAYRFQREGVSPGARAIARIDDLTQLELRMALPVTSNARSQRLVVAAMLEDVVGDVRRELGASYSLHATLEEYRYSTYYKISGWIDTARAADGVRLIKERISALAADPDAAARVFVKARNRVLTQLRSVRASAARMASRVELDVALESAPLSDLQTAKEVQRLTVDKMAHALAAIDLAQATVMMRGPETPMRAAFDVLGRAPQLVHFDPGVVDAEDPNASDEMPLRVPKPLWESDLQPALTDDSPPLARRFTFRVAPGYVIGDTVENSSRVSMTCCEGYAISAAAGYRFDKKLTFGLQLDLAQLSGTYRIDRATAEFPVELKPIDVTAFVEGNLFWRVRGAFSTGLHLDQMTDPKPDSTTADPFVWYGGVSVGLRGSVDAIGIGGHWLGVYGAIRGALATPTGYSSLTLGLEYRFQ